MIRPCLRKSGSGLMREGLPSSAAGKPVTAVVNLKIAGLKWTGSFIAYEIKSLMLDLKAGVIREVSLLEE